MISLLSLAAATLVGNVGIISPLQSSNPMMPIDEFMSRNFSVFVSEYNEFHDEDLIATKLLRTRDLNLENDKSGYYFDFDYGYMVASEDYEIYLISNFDLPYEDDLFLTEGTIYFSGTAFYDESGFEYGITEDNTLTDCKMDSEDTSYLSLASEEKDGEITNDEIDGYISRNYSGYDIVLQDHMVWYDYISQMDTSVYVTPLGDNYYASEGNCVINSTYSMLHNMGRRDRDRKFYYSDYYVDYTGENLTHDAHYSLTQNGWVPNNLIIQGTPNEGKEALKVMPDLYLRLRERAISSYGYNEENGMNGSYAKDMVMDVDGWYGYDTTFYETNDFNTVRSLVAACIPSLVRTSGSTTYGNHSMAVNGYIKLEKTSKWWVFSSTDTKWILAVDDGHQNSRRDGLKSHRRYYDPNKNGGAKFICADKSTIDFSVC